MKARYFLPLAAAILMFAAPDSFAQEDAGSNTPEPVKDYFSFVAEVRIPEEGARDVVAFGGVVNINNPVAQDVLAAGGTVIIQSPVSGDVRVAGGRVVIESDIGGNVAVLAQTVEILPGSTIAGSVEIRARDVVIGGTIAKDAHIVAETLEQNGSIGGELVHDLKASPDYEHTPIGWFFRIVSLFGMLVVGLALVSVFPNSMRAAVHASIKNPAKDLLWGLGALAATPIAVLVLALTIIGLPLGMLLGLGYVVALYLAKILVGIILGTYLLGALRGREQAQKASLLGIMVLGIFVLWLITGIPVIGGILKLIAMIWGLGMLVNLKIQAIKRFES
ncbi:MAG: hypothetical protein HYS45_00175 [Parcubacteria group bacterium]|nr:hypothetical protein [Parcubacteria group bacterium]